MLVGAVFALVTVALFGWNLAISGEWNYQGGEDRSTFYSADPDGPAGPRLGGFPFLTPEATFDTTGLPRETNRVPVEVLITTDAVGAVFRNNLVYFFFGRYAGFVPYLPGAVAIVLFLLHARQRPLWQWLVLGAGLGSAVFFILYMPFTYSGGGGPVGNRYFLGVYPVFLYVMPPLARLRSGLVSLAIGGLFTAQLVAESVLRLGADGRACKARRVPLAAGRVDAAERSAGQPQSVAIEAAARRCPARCRLLHRRQRLSARRRSLLGAR